MKNNKTSDIAITIVIVSIVIMLGFLLQLAIANNAGFNAFDFQGYNFIMWVFQILWMICVGAAATALGSGYLEWREK